MTVDERKSKIESYKNGYKDILKTLEELPRKMWNYKPEQNKWCIHEILIHLADSEANGYIRLRKLIAEPGETVMVYDQDNWARNLLYCEQNEEDALELFELMRKMSYNLIMFKMNKIIDNTINHPENGIMTFDDWLNNYENHVKTHIKQMKRIYEAWREVN